MTASTPGFAALALARRNGAEPLTSNGAAIGASLADFWAWAWSDLANNSSRGVLAEYVVAVAVGAGQGVRMAWDAFDMTTPSGIRIEVKSSCRWQSWYQKAPSLVQFNIRPTREWNYLTNDMALEPKRQAHVYVFAVLDCATKNEINPLEMAQWTFHVISSATLDERFKAQKMASLRALRAAGSVSTDFAGLAATIEACAADSKKSQALAVTPRE